MSLTATIIITGNPPWRARISQQLQADYHVHHQAELRGYINQLIDTRAALILVDSSDPDWVLWTSTPKASPATRRIPLILISEDAGIRANATIQGADFAATPDELDKQIVQWVQDYARLPDPEYLKQLECDCQQDLPELARQGVMMFNAGKYYKQHDLFEEQWMATETAVRDLYRAVLQVGVAYFQIERGNYRGALKMLQRSVQWLIVLPDVCQGIDVRQLRDDSFKVRAELERLGEDGMDAFDLSLLRGVVYHGEPTSAPTESERPQDHDQ
ncbi:MAG: DUF309 domain-containing protein [Anaerolineae bacterium]